MNGHQELVVLAVDPNRVVVVRVLVGGWCELDVDVLGDTRGQHSFLVAADFEIGGLGRQDVETLRRWRVVKHSELKGMSFISFEACKFENTRSRGEESVCADIMKGVFLGKWVGLVGLGLCDEPPLQFNLSGVLGGLEAALCIKSEI